MSFMGDQASADFRTYEELEQQVSALEGTIRTLMNVINKGNEERDELTTALRNAQQLPMIGNGAQTQHQLAISMRSGGSNNVNLSAEEENWVVDDNDDFLTASISNAKRQPVRTVSNLKGTPSSPQTVIRGADNLRQSNSTLRASPPNSTGTKPAPPPAPPQPTAQLAQSMRSVSPMTQRKLMDSGLPEGKMVPRGVGYRSPYAQANMYSTTRRNDRDLAASFGRTETSLALTTSDGFALTSSGSSPKYKRMHEYEKLPARIRNHLLNLEIENKQLKKEVDVLTKEIRKRDSELDHQRIVLTKRVAHAEEYAQNCSSQSAEYEVEMKSAKLKFQEVSTHLQRMIVQQQQMQLAQSTGNMTMTRSVSASNYQDPMLDVSA